MLNADDTEYNARATGASCGFEWDGHHYSLAISFVRKGATGAPCREFDEPHITLMRDADLVEAPVATFFKLMGAIKRHDEISAAFKQLKNLLEGK